MTAGRGKRTKTTGSRLQRKKRGKWPLLAAVAFVLVSGLAVMVVKYSGGGVRKDVQTVQPEMEPRPDLKAIFERYLENSERTSDLKKAMAAEIDAPRYDRTLYAAVVEKCDGGDDQELREFVDKIFFLLQECTDGYPEKKALYDQRIERLATVAPGIVARLEWQRAQLVASEIGDKSLLVEVYDRYRGAEDAALRLAAAEALYRIGSVDDGAELNRLRYEQVLALSGDSQDAGWRMLILRVLFSRALSSEHSADRLAFLDEIALRYSDDMDPDNFSILVRALRERARMTGDDGKLSAFLRKASIASSDSGVVAESLYCMAEEERNRKKAIDGLTAIVSRFGVENDGEARRIVGKALERLVDLADSDSSKIEICDEIIARFRSSAAYLDSESVANAYRVKAKLDGDSDPLIRYYDACIRGAHNRKRRAKLLYEKAGAMSERYDKNRLFDEIVNTYGYDNENDVLDSVALAIGSRVMHMKDEDEIAALYLWITANPLFRRPRWSHELQRAYQYLIEHAPDRPLKLELCDEFIAAMEEVDNPAKIGAVIVKCGVLGNRDYTIEESMRLEEEFFNYDSTAVNHGLARLYAHAAGLARYPWVKAHFYDLALARLGTSFDYSGVLLNAASDIVGKKAAALDDHMIIEDYFQERIRASDDVYARVVMMDKWVETCWPRRWEEKRMIRRMIMDEGRGSRDRRVLRIVAEAGVHLLGENREKEDLERVAAFVTAHIGDSRSGSQAAIARLGVMLANIESRALDKKRLCDLVIATCSGMIGVERHVRDAEDILDAITPARGW